MTFIKCSAERVLISLLQTRIWIHECPRQNYEAEGPTSHTIGRLKMCLQMWWQLCSHLNSELLFNFQSLLLSHQLSIETLKEVLFFISVMPNLCNAQQIHRGCWFMKNYISTTVIIWSYHRETAMVIDNTSKTTEHTDILWHVKTNLSWTQSIKV